MHCNFCIYTQTCIFGYIRQNVLIWQISNSDDWWPTRTMTLKPTFVKWLTHMNSCSLCFTGHMCRTSVPKVDQNDTVNSSLFWVSKRLSTEHRKPCLAMFFRPKRHASWRYRYPLVVIIPQAEIGDQYHYLHDQPSVRSVTHHSTPDSLTPCRRFATVQCKMPATGTLDTQWIFC